MRRGISGETWTKASEGQPEIAFEKSPSMQLLMPAALCGHDVLHKVPEVNPLKPYGKNDPRLLPAYSVAEAAHYLRIPPATLRSWVAGRYYPTKRGRRKFEPLIETPSDGSKVTDGLALSFVNLVEAHVLAAVRRSHGVTIQKVRRALEYLSRGYHSHHPLAEYQLETDGLDLFISEYGKLVNISTAGQLAMREVMKAHLRRIERDPHDHSAVRFFPFTRPDGDSETAPKFVVIDPLVSFGRPVLRGTGVPTAVIRERFWGGDSVKHLASDYGLEPTEIEEAIRCELEAAA